MNTNTPSTTDQLADANTLHWTENEQACSARWHSEKNSSAPKRVIFADDQLTADTAYRYACAGTAMLWRGDFQNARQLLQALARRADRPSKKSARAAIQPKPMPEAFHLHRLAQSQRARTLDMLLIPFNADYSIPLRRAPDVSQACNEVYGKAGEEGFVISLRELLGLISAHEWRKKGVSINTGESGIELHIHPHYGVFAPVRGEYVALVADAPLPPALSKKSLAFDIGTGTGVLAAVLMKRGLKQVIATEQDARALSCARDNLNRLYLSDQVDLLETDLFPPGQAPLIVCNPPWVPARPSSPIEHAIYDPESRMLKGFLSGLAAHLAPGGEGWLILSDLAEHLGLRSRAELLEAIDAGGLKVLGRLETKATHAKASDATDPLYAARQAEVTSLWRLAAA